MTQRSAISQKNLERLIKAAGNAGAIVQVDLKKLVATVLPAEMKSTERPETIRKVKERGDEQPLPCGPNALQEWRKQQQARFGDGYKSLKNL